MATLLVNTGKANVTSALTSSANKYIGWGTGAGTTALTDTTLFTETGSRTAGTQSQQTTTTTNDTYQVTGTTTAGGALAITNAGIFDASTSGDLFAKGDFSTINLSKIGRAHV